MILESQGSTTSITGSSKKAPLSAIWPCGMEVSISEALDMSRSPHLIISYLPKSKCGGLEVIISWLIG